MMLASHLNRSKSFVIAKYCVLQLVAHFLLGYSTAIYIAENNVVEESALLDIATIELLLSLLITSLIFFYLGRGRENRAFLYAFVIITLTLVLSLGLTFLIIGVFSIESILFDYVTTLLAAFVGVSIGISFESRSVVRKD